MPNEQGVKSGGGDDVLNGAKQVEHALKAKNLPPEDRHTLQRSIGKSNSPASAGPLSLQLERTNQRIEDAVVFDPNRPLSLKTANLARAGSAASSSLAPAIQQELSSNPLVSVNRKRARSRKSGAELTEGELRAEVEECVRQIKQAIDQRNTDPVREVINFIRFSSSGEIEEIFAEFQASVGQSVIDYLRAAYQRGGENLDSAAQLNLLWGLAEMPQEALEGLKTPQGQSSFMAGLEMTLLDPREKEALEQGNHTRILAFALRHALSSPNPMQAVHNLTGGLDPSLLTEELEEYHGLFNEPFKDPKQVIFERECQRTTKRIEKQRELATTAEESFQSFRKDWERSRSGVGGFIYRNLLKVMPKSLEQQNTTYFYFENDAVSKRSHVFFMEADLKAAGRFFEQSRAAEEEARKSAAAGQTEQSIEQHKQAYQLFVDALTTLNQRSLVYRYSGADAAMGEISRLTDEAVNEANSAIRTLKTVKTGTYTVAALASGQWWYVASLAGTAVAGNALEQGLEVGMNDKSGSDAAKDFALNSGADVASIGFSRLGLAAGKAAGSVAGGALKTGAASIGLNTGGRIVQAASSLTAASAAGTVAGVTIDAGSQVTHRVLFDERMPIAQRLYRLGYAGALGAAGGMLGGGAQSARGAMSLGWKKDAVSAVEYTASFGLGYVTTSGDTADKLAAGFLAAASSKVGNDAIARETPVRADVEVRTSEAEAIREVIHEANTEPIAAPEAEPQVPMPRAEAETAPAPSPAPEQQATSPGWSERIARQISNLKEALASATDADSIKAYRSQIEDLSQMIAKPEGELPTDAGQVKDLAEFGPTQRETIAVKQAEVENLSARLAQESNASHRALIEETISSLKGQLDTIISKARADLAVAKERQAPAAESGAESAPEFKGDSYGDDPGSGSDGGWWRPDSGGEGGPQSGSPRGGGGTAVLNKPIRTIEKVVIKSEKPQAKITPDAEVKVAPDDASVKAVVDIPELRVKTPVIEIETVPEIVAKQTYTIDIPQPEIAPIERAPLNYRAAVPESETIKRVDLKPLEVPIRHEPLVDPVPAESPSIPVRAVPEAPIIEPLRAPLEVEIPAEIVRPPLEVAVPSEIAAPADPIPVVRVIPRVALETEPIVIPHPAEQLQPIKISSKIAEPGQRKRDEDWPWLFDPYKEEKKRQQYEEPEADYPDTEYEPDPIKRRAARRHRSRRRHVTTLRSSRCMPPTIWQAAGRSATTASSPRRSSSGDATPSTSRRTTS
ncbi:MAG: hypothetical protein DCC75_06760 [Proteobacteria bacterium]|nr:MAG: hypothetical protein DCC75_06760 [Pseudomonadota bacterium]